MFPPLLEEGGREEGHSEHRAPFPFPFLSPFLSLSSVRAPNSDNNNDSSSSNDLNDRNRGRSEELDGFSYLSNGAREEEGGKRGVRKGALHISCRLQRG